MNLSLIWSFSASLSSALVVKGIFEKGQERRKPTRIPLPAINCFYFPCSPLLSVLPSKLMIRTNCLSLNEALTIMLWSTLAVR